jgi:uncharacterized protein YfaS (alpha-2-macroglobulin family)
VYTRYWLHNKGPAPIGNLPTAIHLSPQHLTPGDPGRIRLTIATSGQPAAGQIELIAPDELTVTAPTLDYNLTPGEFTEFEITVDTEGTPHGTYFIAARITDENGQAFQDVLTIDVGQDTPTPPLDIALTPTPQRLTPGNTGELTVRLRNDAAATIAGEAQLISPYGTWGPAADLLIEPWTQGFEITPGATTTIPFTIRAATTAQPGTWWALVKISYYGRLHYTETIAIEITPTPEKDDE